MKPAIHCSCSDIWPIAKFQNHPKNPNRHSHEQIALLAKIIQVHGWRRPIVVSTRSNLIVKGHGRLMAAKVAGLTEAPVEFQDYESEAEELADLVADNRVAEFAEVDQAFLQGMIAELSNVIDVDLTGFSEKALASLNSSLPQEAQPSTEAKPKKQRQHKIGARVVQYNIVFDDQLQQQQWFAFLKHLATKYPEKETIGDRIIAAIAS